MGEIFYGNELQDKLIKEMHDDIAMLASEFGRAPRLDTILVGDNSASASYVKSKQIACEKAGVINVIHKLPGDVSLSELEGVIKQCNDNSNCDGVLVQLPLPPHLDQYSVIDMINKDKDIDGLTSRNISGLYGRGDYSFLPCTPTGIMIMLDEMGVKLDGARAVVIGRSRLVGAPIARLLQNKNATVTVCHSHTKNLKEICREADILVAAAGKAEMIDHTYIKPGAYVIDVGINRGDSGKLYGDVNTEDVLPYVKYVTPVPKGVGPMTVYSLIQNVLMAYMEHNNLMHIEMLTPLNNNNSEVLIKCIDF